MNQSDATDFSLEDIQTLEDCFINSVSSWIHIWFISVYRIWYIWASVWQKGAYDMNVILVRKEHYDVTAVYFCICTKSQSFEQWKIYVIEK